VSILLLAVANNRVMLQNASSLSIEPMSFVVLYPQRESKWKGEYDAFARDLRTHVKASLPGFVAITVRNMTHIAIEEAAGLQLH